MYRYPLIALDLDGTLTNHDKEVTPLTRQALMEAQTDGATLVLASGRPTYGIKPVAETLGLDKAGGYVLAYNGGKVIEWKTGRELFAQSLPAEVIPYLHHYARTRGYALLGYRDGDILTELPDDAYVREEARINRMSVTRVDNLLDALESHPTKLLMTGNPPLMVQAEAELADALGGKMDVYRSAPFFVELVPKGVDKAQSLMRLLGRLNLSPAELMAFGDGYNDLSMLRLAGMGVAMANAVPELRAAADYVTDSNEEDGVAKAIRHFRESAE